MASFTTKIASHENSDSDSDPRTPEEDLHKTFYNLKLKAEHLIPKDKEAWMVYIKDWIRKKCSITYLTDGDLEKILYLSKKIVCATKKYTYKKDPDVPEWYYWTTEEVVKWIIKTGHPECEEMFRVNGINGRRLCEIDASALNKMGLQYFEAIKSVAEKIRSLIGFQYPNSLRSSARKLPFEEFLKSNLKRGKTYDLRTFQQFCSRNDYEYDPEKPIQPNPPPAETCPVSITPYGRGIRIVKSVDSLGSKNSLEYAPTVEFIVRTVGLRNQIVDEILEDFLRSVFSNDIGASMSTLALGNSLRCKMTKAYSDLGIDNTERCGSEQLHFSAMIAIELFNEIVKTKLLFDDIHELQHYIEEEVSEEVTTAIMGLMALDLKLLMLQDAASKIELSLYAEEEEEEDEEEDYECI